MKRKCFAFFLLQLLPCLLLLGAIAFSGITEAQKTVRAGSFGEGDKSSNDGFSDIAHKLTERFLYD